MHVNRLWDYPGPGVSKAHRNLTRHSHSVNRRSAWQIIVAEYKAYPNRNPHNPIISFRAHLLALKTPQSNKSLRPHHPLPWGSYELTNGSLGPPHLPKELSQSSARKRWGIFGDEFQFLEPENVTFSFKAFRSFKKQQDSGVVRFMQCSQ